MNVNQHLQRAEELWQQGATDEAIQEYDAALAVVRAQGDAQMEGTILVGKGYALMNSTDAEHRKTATSALELAMSFAESEMQKKFIQELLEKACADYNFPQGCYATMPDQLASHALSDLQLDEQILVQLVAESGPGNWEEKSTTIVERLYTLPSVPEEMLRNCRSAEYIEARWNAIAPIVRIRLEAEVQMPCGHTCGTCPTRNTCHLHEALDIEDIGQPSSSPV